MKQFHKWQLALLLPIISLAFASCGGEDDEEPDSTGSNDTTVDVINLEDVIIGSWDAIDDDSDRGLTFKDDGTYYYHEKVSWWEKGDYIVAGDKIVFTPMSDWTGYEYDMDYSMKYQRFTWQFEYRNGRLYVTDEDGEIFTMAKSRSEHVYVHAIVGKWALTDDDYTENWQFKADGNFIREVYISNRLYGIYSGTYTLLKNSYIRITYSSDYNVETYRYAFGNANSILTFINSEDEFESYNRVE